MKKLLVIPIFFTCCTKTQPKVELWGNDSTGYFVRTFDKSGKEYLRWSDTSSDTASMRLSAELIRNSN